MRPGILGGANWGGAAFDPQTHILYVKVNNMAAVAKLVSSITPARVPKRSTQTMSPRAARMASSTMAFLSSRDHTVWSLP